MTSYLLSWCCVMAEAYVGGMGVPGEVYIVSELCTWHTSQRCPVCVVVTEGSLAARVHIDSFVRDSRNFYC